MIALALLVAAAAPSNAPNAQNAVVAAKPKLLVLDFQDQGVGENAVKIVHDTLAAHLSQDARLDVISTEDMRRVLDVEAQKRAVGNCSDESCLAEIAEALGAQLTVYGTAGKLGELVVVNVSMFDATAGKSVGRETVQAKSLEELPDKIATAGDALVARIPGLAAPASSSSFGALGWSGVAALGAGAVVAGVGGLVAWANNPTPSDGRTFDEKEAALPVRDAFLGVVGVGAGIAVIGGGLVVAGMLE